MTKRILTLMLALAFCLTLPVNAANIIVVTETRDNDSDGIQDDQGLIDFLVAEGHNVDARIDNWVELDADKIAELNAADLIIVSRGSNSGSYDDGDEPTQWNSIETPLILMNTYLIRTTRWLWMNTTTIPVVDFPIMEAVLPDHPYFDGVEVDADNIVLAIDGSVGMGRVSFIEPIDLGSGTLIAQTIEGYPWIAEWPAGVEFYEGSGQIPAATRVMYSTGTQEIDSNVDPQGAHNLTADGEQILRNIIAALTPAPPVITSVVRANGASGDRDPIGAYDGSTTPLPMEPGGLKDGNLVFSDRTYPWAGIPAEYTGTEYIRTFNSDKNGGLVDVTYTVTTSQYAIVWITVDDRIPAEWNSGGTINSQQDAADRVTAAIGVQFLDTGIDIYVREAADGSNDRPMSVFAAELPAGTYIFDSMDSGKNFYTIGAIPTEAPPAPPAPPAVTIADVTGPGDTVLGIPRGLPCGGSPTANYSPCGELPPLVVDDNSGTKYLNFGGNFDEGEAPSGFQITPAAGSTIVTGMTFTTANDAPDRDPVAFELYGSNESIDGPFELIAAGEIVDFAMETEWPRFTMNETPISFDNAVAYKHYKVLFTAIRGTPAEANSMQIAEVELLGVKLEAGSPSPADGAENVGIDVDLSWSAGSYAISHDVYFGTEIPPAFAGNVGTGDVTGPGDTVLGIPRGLPCGGSPTANYSPCGELPPLVVDDNSGTKYLNFGGNFDEGEEPSGFLITPASGASVVIGMTFTTANDAPDRDPVAFELYGSNESIEGPFELIAAGEIVDFAMATEWPRFTKNATEITFDNDVAYDHYKVLFTAIRGTPATANSMQIAEVELIGFKKSPSFNPGILEYGTTYYWQVDEVEADGTVRPGALWSFTTTTPVGIFEYTQDIGAPSGIGRTTYEGYVWKSDKLSEQYLLMGGGHDVWDNSDDFHYAYNKVSGDVRVSANFEWIVKSNDWAKYGVMLRNSTAGGSAHRFMCERGLSDYAGMQGRTSDGGGSSEFGTAWTAGAVALGIQRVTVEGLTVIEGLADFGNGWESRAAELVFEGFGDEILAGVAITSHDDTHLAQARCWNVRYELNPSMVGELDVPTIPASADLGAPTSDVPGFKIDGLKPLVTDGWGFDAVREIFDTGMYMGLPPQPGSEGTRISEFVNMRDTGNGVFSVDNGYPDETVPGVDPDETPAADPAAGDDDENYGAQVTASIHLTAGLHIVGANSDDGTIIEIGGVEIGRTAEAKGTSNVDFVFQVEADGYYDLRALYIEIGGGSSLELHEVLLDGTRLLLNDVANGGSAVYAPAP